MPVPAYAEELLQKKIFPRTKSDRNISPSLVFRLISPEISDAVPISGTYEYQRDFLPLFAVACNEADVPFAGQIDSPASAFSSITDLAPDLCGIDLRERSNNSYTLRLFYRAFNAWINANDPARDFYKLIELINSMPDEIFIPPQVVNISEDNANAIALNKYRFLIVEKR